MRYGVNKPFYRDISKLVEEYFEESILVTREAFKAAKIPINCQTYFDETEKYSVYAVRTPCGIEGNRTSYSELVFVQFKDVLDQEGFNEMVEDLSVRRFFEYRDYYEVLYSRSVYVFAKRFRGFVAARKKRNSVSHNQFYVPVLGKDSFVKGWIYFLGFLKKRIDGFIHSLCRWGWNSAKHEIFKKYTAMLSLSYRHLSLRKMCLYYIHIVESTLKELEEKRQISDDVITTGRTLLTIFDEILKHVDSLLKPYLLREMAKLACRILKERFESLKVVELAREYLAEVELTHVRKRLDMLSRATPLRG